MHDNKQTPASAEALRIMWRDQADRAVLRLLRQRLPVMPAICAWHDGNGQGASHTICPDCLARELRVLELREAAIAVDRWELRRADMLVLAGWLVGCIIAGLLVVRS